MKIWNTVLKVTKFAAGCTGSAGNGASGLHGYEGETAAPAANGFYGSKNLSDHVFVGKIKLEVDGPPRPSIVQRVAVATAVTGGCMLVANALTRDTRLEREREARLKAELERDIARAVSK